jgi:hypothetical protein
MQAWTGTLSSKQYPINPGSVEPHYQKKLGFKGKADAPPIAESVLAYNQIHQGMTDIHLHSIKAFCILFWH